MGCSDPGVEAYYEKEHMMTVESRLELVVSSFKSPAGAGLVLAALIDAGGEALRGVKDLAIVRRGDDTRLHIEESRDMSAGRVAYGGGMVGLLLGILGGPLGMLIGGATGAAIGGLAGKVIDTGIPDDRLREIGALLAANTSAIVAMVEPGQAEPLLAAISQGGGTTIAHPLAADVPDRLRAMQAESDAAAEASSRPSDTAGS
jgi:uncharacterized membrane protein